MENLLKKEYLHLGTDHIYKELWQNIQMDQIYPLSKPYGGIWASHTRFDDKENIRFLQVNDSNDFKNLKESGFTKSVTSKLIDLNYNVEDIPYYEKISEFYDLLYVNPNANPSLKKYCFNTMLALNPDAIEYYKSVMLDIEKQTIIKYEEKKKLTEPTQKYYDLVKYINGSFKNIGFSGNYQEYILKLNSYKKELTKIIKNNIDDKYLNDVKTNTLIDTIIQNSYREKYLEKQKILLKQA